MLFGSGIDVGMVTRYTIPEGIPFIHPWSADLGVIPGTNVVGSNRPRHDRDSSHGSLMQVDLGLKRLHDCWGTNQCACIELGNRVSLRHDVLIPKISCKIGKAVEDLLKETVTVPVKQRYRANIFRPTYPVEIVDNGDKVEKDLAKDWLRLIIRADCGGDCVHVNANAREINHGMHCSNASNRSLALSLMRIGQVHNVLRCSFYLTGELALDKTFVPLSKKGRWLN
jgi:hypothetical protein